MEAGTAYEAYTVWLDRQPLASRSREAYRAQVGSYLRWLADTGDPEAALTQQDQRDWAVRDYKRQMKVQKRWSATTVNQALAAGPKNSSAKSTRQRISKSLAGGWKRSTPVDDR